MPAEDLSPEAHRLDRTDQAIARAAMFLAGQVGVRAIVALTESGATAQWLSRFRSTVPIYGLSRVAAARRRMLLYRDVNPVDFDPHGVSPGQASRDAILTLFRLGALAEEDRVIVTTGDRTGLGGGTNTIRLLKVGRGGIAEGMGDL
jgi:pyruvate kinase